MHKLDRYLQEIQKKMFYPVGAGKGVEQIPFEGKTLYTSQILKENVKKSIQKYLPKQTSAIIIKAIDNGKVVPVFLTKGIVDYIIKRKKFKSHSLGAAREGKAFIFIDRLYERFKLTSVNEKKLSDIVLHELMHVIDHIDTPAFFKINYSLFLVFWKVFFTKYLDLKGTISNKIFNHIIKDQFNLIIGKKRFFTFEEMYDPVFKALEKYSSLIPDREKTFELLYKDLIEFADKTYAERFVRIIPADIADAKNAAYVKITKGKTESFGQELWNPGEILSVVAEITPNHPNVIKTLKIL